MAAEDFRNLIETPSDRVIVALDNMGWSQAHAIMGEAGPYVGMGKANSLALDFGWIDAVERISRADARTMADPKLNDIPKTVELGAKAITRAGATLITVHASAGPDALSAAVTGRDAARAEMDEDGVSQARRKLLGGILAITVLTSLSPRQSMEIFGDQPKAKALDFAKMAVDSGVDGIVCSPAEVSAIRDDRATENLLLVVPGITPIWAKKAADQSRVGTPHSAILDGADFLVVGRAITAPPEGMSHSEAAQRIAEEIADVER